MTFTCVFFTCYSQCKIKVDGSFIYSDILISNSHLKSYNTSALIDTGCSMCVIDSTFAVDTCGISIRKMLPNTVNKDRIKVHTTYVDAVSFCGKLYNNVYCIVADLKGIYKHYAPKFIIGANILKQERWKIDTKAGTMEPCKENLKTISYKWKNHRDYIDVAKDYIVLVGDIDNQKTRFIFDTGSKFNKLPHDFKLRNYNAASIEEETASIGKKISVEQLHSFKDVNFKIGNDMYSSDFIEGKKENIGCINITFLNGKTFILDYPQQKFEIVCKNKDNAKQ